MLTNEEKISIVNQHKRNLEYSKYNVQISLIEENASAAPDASTVAILESDIENITRKLQALDDELATLV